uniref:Transcriptional coactivator p15 (PC4) C-terminal domain-containing protein n=1 Tax=Hemiselmis andersenii TaxID=464988 RepID=A0A6U4PS68_HEMAN|mmetsp:Transcript_4134/g.9407  ORF Transcript_4134/g.9407 Transcript_4134/m.9407 type:complete len:115 (+) Transcript_4134:153-497(+)|eukprot:CAMPEP_0172025884 /NCGR_PEP_ID=MMETSP1041-20130122/16136_1 /TAXON_ID=464988 /ORGANISM="Hemiselmis andersenii, Strain CCMP439" /LENGTH=114 /DNA_ID=CAMNT_0012681611 /DNA_START=82 /DNA_END=426 /DNA_ORIENTATION=-
MPPVKDEEEQTHHKRPREEDGDEGKDVKSEPKKPKGTWEESGEEGHMVISQGRNQKRVTVSKFKGIVLVGLREYYEKDNKWLPGKSGISLTLEQWEAVVGVSESVTALAKKLSS